MVEREAVVGHAKLHAKPAADLVALAKRFRSEVRIGKDGEAKNAKDPMGVLALGAAKGEEVRVIAAGPDEDEAVRAVASFVAGDTP